MESHARQDLGHGNARFRHGRTVQTVRVATSPPRRPGEKGRLSTLGSGAYTPLSQDTHSTRPVPMVSPYQTSKDALGLTIVGAVSSQNVSDTNVWVEPGTKSPLSLTACAPPAVRGRRTASTESRVPAANTRAPRPHPASDSRSRSGPRSRCEGKAGSSPREAQLFAFIATRPAAPHRGLLPPLNGCASRPGSRGSAPGRRGCGTGRRSRRDAAASTESAHVPSRAA